MPKASEIKDLFYTYHSSKFTDLLSKIYNEYPYLLKEDINGEVSYEFVEFILHNINILKLVEK